MANKLYEETDVQAIAEKIRERAATDSLYTVKEMPNGVDAVYSKGYADGQAAGGSGGGIIPTGEIKIEQNGTYDVSNYASALVEVASSGGGSSVHCGKVTIEGAEEGDGAQVTAHTVFEFDIGIISDIRSISLFYVDPNGTFVNASGRQFAWHGTTSFNAYCRTSAGGVDPVSVLDESAANLRYDQTTGKLYAMAGQWSNVVRGTYFWVAVTGGDL